MGHEYAGTVEDVGSDVTTIRPGPFVVGSFFAPGNTCEARAGYQTACVNKEVLGPSGAPQSQRTRVGSPARPKPAPARPSRSSATARLGCSA
jgi:Zn-dependent alcohol dehydrogenase